MVITDASGSAASFGALPRRCLAGIFIVLSCAISGAVAAADIDVRSDRDPAVINQSFNLIFTAQGKLDDKPDFSPLTRNFDILGRSQHTSMSWVNGKASRVRTWTLNVMPRRAGDIEIPSIAFGADRSPADRITVASSADDGIAGGEDDLFVEVDVDTRNPYVQQQVLLTVRIWTRIVLNERYLSDPAFSAEAIVKQLGKARTDRRERDGRRYEVLEVQFAVFPQESGPLTIRPFTFTTQVVQGSRSVWDPFRQAVATRRLNSDAVELDVRPAPPGFSGSVWLPAKRLRLHEEWSAPPGDAEVGQPTTRTIYLWVDGLTAAQLPELNVAPPDGVNVYPDQPELSDQETGSGMTSVRQEKTAVIPLTAGAVELPEIIIPWWNTVTDQQEIARLPAHSMIEAGAAAPPVDPATALPAVELPTDQAAAPDALTAPTAATGPWPLIAAAALVLWLATLLLWYLSTRRGERPAAPAPSRSAAASTRDVRRACQSDDAAATREALLGWARARHPDAALNSLNAVAARCPGALGDAIRALNRALYSQQPVGWSGKALLQAFEAAADDDRQAASSATSEQKLQPLYRLIGRPE
ncbi:MAG: protein BatD [Gammaproteobacteria bacterium]|nr:protein BatD [Gammaproteobacteria bacterium]